MRKLLATILTMIMVVSLFCIMPASANVVLDIQNVADVGAAAYNEARKAYYLGNMYSYIGFDNVDLTGMNSVEITAMVSHRNYNDGDVIQVRLGSPKGKLLGYVDFNKHAPEESLVFKGAITPTQGIHKLYFVSTMGYAADTCYIQGIKLSPDKYSAPKYVPVPEEKIVDTHYTTWALTDDLGRKVASFEEAGPKREGKSVALFYWTWHSNWETSDAMSMTNFAAAHPELKYDYDNPAWPQNTTWYWDEPLFGFYAGADYWVLRKHAQMFANAGVDVLFFDCTNNQFTFRRTVDAMTNAFHDAREDGLNVPKIAFMSNFNPSASTGKNNITRTYMNYYKDGKNSDLWFYWEGKPLIMAYTTTLVGRADDPDDAALMEEIKNFFTFRGPQPSHKVGEVITGQWAWLQTYPQKQFVKNEDGTFEEMTVGVAVNHSYVDDEITAMNDNYSMGRSYTNAFGDDNSAGASKKGYFFTEQLNYVLEMDPELMFITGWNEWKAGRVDNWAGVLNASPDVYDTESSRDAEPTKGALKDIYYCLLVDAIRKFKGVEPTPVAGAEKTIDIKNPASFSDVTPVFYNDKGVYNRDHAGFGDRHYENYTARNNVIISKVSRDAANLYFYAETNENITAPEGSKWMKLYIDADRNHATGWEGYDFVVNCPAAGDISSLATGTAVKIGTVEYSLSGKTLIVKIPRATLGLTGTLNFEFKWVDNAEGDIMNFYIDGNSAPMGRFNYVYTQIAETYLSEAQRAALKGITVVQDGSNKVYVNGKKMHIYEPDTRVTAKMINGVMYIPSYILEESLNYRTTYDYERGVYKLDTGKDFFYCNLGANAIKKNGRDMTITNPVTFIDGTIYIAVTTLKEVFGIETYTQDNKAAFGKGINASIVKALSF